MKRTLAILTSNVKHSVVNLARTCQKVSYLLNIPMHIHLYSLFLIRGSDMF